MSQQTNDAAAVPKEAKLLSFDEILSADDTEYATINVPEWGGAVRLGTLNAEDLVEFLEANENPELKKIAGIRLLNKSLVDSEGKRIGNEERQKMLLKKQPKVVGRLVKEVLKLNGMQKQAEEVEKNALGEATTGASPIV